MSEWTEVALRRLFRVVNGGTPTPDPENWDGHVPWATPVDLGIRNGGILTSTERTLSLQGLRTGSAVVPAGSLVLSTRAPIGYVAQSGQSLAFNQGCRGLVPKCPLDIRYYRYVVFSFVEQLAARGQGSTFIELSTEALESTLVPVPPFSAQREIADFLDGETARIDALITKKRQLSGLLAARTQTVVEREVLGLVHDAVHPARSRWFTDVPRGWNETVLGQMRCEVQTGPFGSQLHASEYVQDGCPIVNPANLIGGRLKAIPSMAVSSGKRDELRRHVLQPGDIVFGRRGEMGRAGLVECDQAGWLCGTGSIRLRLSGKAMLPGYLKTLLETRALRAYFGLSSVGSTMENLNADILRSTPVLLPPLADQQAIIRRTFDIERRAGAHRTAVSRQITLLQERRQALITAAVTGELDIAGAA